LRILVYYIPQRKIDFVAGLRWRDILLTETVEEQGGSARHFVTGYQCYRGRSSMQDILTAHCASWPADVHKKWLPDLGSHQLEKDLFGSGAIPWFDVSNVVARGIAVSDRHLGIGHQPTVEGLEEAAEQARGWRESDSGGLGHIWFFLRLDSETDLI